MMNGVQPMFGGLLISAQSDPEVMGKAAGLQDTPHVEISVEPTAPENQFWYTMRKNSQPLAQDEIRLRVEGRVRSREVSLGNFPEVGELTRNLEAVTLAEYNPGKAESHRLGDLYPDSAQMEKLVNVVDGAFATIHQSPLVKQARHYARQLLENTVLTAAGLGWWPEGAPATYYWFFRDKGSACSIKRD